MPRPSPPARALASSASLGAAAGALEACGLVLRDAPRDPAAGARAALVAALLYGALALGLGLFATAVAALARRRERDPPSAVAGPLAAGLAALAYVATAEVGLRLLPAVAVVAGWVLARADLPRALRALTEPARAAALASAPLAVAAAGVAASSSGAGAARAVSAVAAVVVLGLAAAVVAGRSLRPRAAAALPLPLAAGALALLAGSAPRPGATAAPPAGAPHVVLVTFDTLRRDRVGCYGHAPARTAAIDRLAGEGALFLDASAHAPVTGPSHTSMLTGLLPPQHGAVANGVHPDPRVATLADHLSAAGWQTGAFVSGFTLTDASCGLAARFDRYGDDLFAWRLLGEASTRLRLVRELARHAERLGLDDPDRIDRPADEVVDEALAWLDDRDPDRPVLLWTHFFDAHAPYEPPAAYDAPPPGLEDVAPENWYALDTPERRALVADPDRVARMVARYDGEIAFADAQLARLRAALEERGLFDDAVVVVTADHGESLGEHGTWFDHVYLYQTELAVPLVVRLPGARGAGARVARPVSHVDLLPTLLEACGLGVPDDLPGASLLAGFDGAEPPERASWAFGRLEGSFGGLELAGTQASLRRGRWKMIRFSDHWLDSEHVPGRERLYDLEREPLEAREAEHAPADVEEMRRALETWGTRAADVRADRDLSDDEMEELRRLGYL